MSEGWGAARDTQGNLKSCQTRAEPGCCWGPALCAGGPRRAGFFLGLPLASRVRFAAGVPQSVGTAFHENNLITTLLLLQPRGKNLKQIHKKANKKHNARQPPPPLSSSHKTPNPAAFLKTRGQTILIWCRRSLLSLRGSRSRCAGAEPGAAAAT